ncbi:unnamed protein product [Didymodactylos carnosus]|uniref:Transposase n=1 Tax=Didymodactylos carnosus TaxID=1234261 RepID=A0A8S2G6P3_9BILA|nr:unnamed protein product [Didymodactylos carnosus]CAF4465915.1 unnamed protein product [Didymodactylos carnosus]
MCWAHVVRKVRRHGALIKNKDEFLLVEQNIMQLQLSFSDQIFITAANLMINKWKLDKDLEKFTDYFALGFWYEGACILIPSTNNGLESLNGRIKQHYTRLENILFQGDNTIILIRAGDEFYSK